MCCIFRTQCLDLYESGVLYKYNYTFLWSGVYLEENTLYYFLYYILKINTKLNIFLLSYSEVHLMHVVEFTSIRQEERMTFELVQQFSRIWLGNPGESQPSMWREEWFKEGLATYLAYYFWTQVRIKVTFKILE